MPPKFHIWIVATNKGVPILIYLLKNQRRKETEDEEEEDEEEGKRGYILWQFLAINFLKSLTALVQNRGKDHFGHFLKHKGPKWKF